jgi:hypothetical protein
MNNCAPKKTLAIDSALQEQKYAISSRIEGDERRNSTMTAAGTGQPNGIDKSSHVVLKDGAFDLTTKSDLDAILRDLKEDQPFVIHFHGGLVDLQAGLSGASFLKDKYIQAEARPLFFIWESGWKEIVEQNLPQIFGETIFTQVFKRVTELARAKVSQASSENGQEAKGIGLLHVNNIDLDSELKAAASGPPKEDLLIGQGGIEPLTPMEMQQAQALLQHDPVIQTQSAQIANSLQPPEEDAKGTYIKSSTKTLMSREVLKEMETPEGGGKGLISLASIRIVSGALKLLVRVIERFRTRRDHGFYNTIVEEILREFYVDNAGKFLWDGMKKETVDAFGSDETRFGGTALLKGLAALEKPPKRIILVGHSAGSIYICHLLENARRMFSKGVFEVVLIAPAVTFEQLGSTFKGLGVSSNVSKLRIFGMNDERERANALVPGAKFFYQSSLLYFVSGLLESSPDKPILGMQRYYSGNSPYQIPEIIDVLANALFGIPHAKNWAECKDGYGLNCDMLSHGGIDKAPALISSLQYMIKTGF